MPVLLCLLDLFGGMVDVRAVVAVLVGPACGLGGPGAIATTPALAPAAVVDGAAMLPAFEPTDPVVDLGDSDSVLVGFGAVGVVAGVCATEFLREDFLEERVEETGTEFPLPRLRFLITSVFSESGRTTPCSLRKRPQALQSGCPSGFRLHNGVVWVKQLVHVVGPEPLSGCLVPPGLTGREGAAELKPDSGGVLGDD